MSTNGKMWVVYWTMLAACVVSAFLDELLPAAVFWCLAITMSVVGFVRSLRDFVRAASPRMQVSPHDPHTEEPTE